jgi:hypothetical protein
MTKKQCPLGEDCDLTLAWMMGAAEARDKAKARIEALEAEIEKLKNLLCLADEAIMDLNGCFPLGHNQREHALRKACLAIRAVTGDDYDERKRRAGATLAEIEGGKG